MLKNGTTINIYMYTFVTYITHRSQLCLLTIPHFDWSFLSTDAYPRSFEIKPVRDGKMEMIFRFSTWTNIIFTKETPGISTKIFFAAMFLKSKQIYQRIN